MNICFLYGKVISNIEFNFILNSKNISIVSFSIELLNNSRIKVKAYDEIADYCYSRLKKKDNIYIKGYLENNEIYIEEMKVVR